MRAIHQHTDTLEPNCSRRCPPPTPLLEVEHLRVEFQTRSQTVRAVSGLSFRLDAGRSLAIVGESGSGKSVACRALLRLLPKRATVTGRARFCGKDLLTLGELELRKYRGSEIGIAFQDAENGLNPIMKVGRQISEAIRLHRRIGEQAARREAIELLRSFDVPEPEERFHAYPHELSGGLKQRVMLAIALAGRPKLLIADETTRGLDVTTQAKVLRLLKEAQQQRGMAIILISHDLGVVARFVDHVLVMYRGVALEYAPTRQLLESPMTPYARALLDAWAARDLSDCRSRKFADLECFVGGSQARQWLQEARAQRLPRASSVSAHRRRFQAMNPDLLRTAAPGAVPPLLDVVDVVQRFGKAGWRRGGGVPATALSRVSFQIRRGETLGLVGESGCGKTTLARTIMQMPPPQSGQVWFNGCDLTRLRGRQLQKQRVGIQTVFQDPYASLNPRWRVLDIVQEPLICAGGGISRRERRRRAEEALADVGLPASTFGKRFPGELSGGQCQRVAIARAIVNRPALMICDEALSSLDALVQAEILRLLDRLQSDHSLSYLFISHDLSVVRRISHRVAVLYFGHLCEIAPVDALRGAAAHPYTRELLASQAVTVPRSSTGNGKQSVLRGQGGCPFYARCPRAQSRCTSEAPPLTRLARDHLVSCHFPRLA